MKRLLGICFLVGGCISGFPAALYSQQNPENSDIVAQQFVTVPLESSAIGDAWRNLVKKFVPPQQSNSEQAEDSAELPVVRSMDSACPTVSAAKKPAIRALIVHYADWRANGDGGYSLNQSLWRTYRMHQKKDNNNVCVLTEVVSEATGQPMLYADQSAWFLGINHFSQSIDPVWSISVTYKVTAIPGQAENVQSLGALASALLGVSTTKAQAKEEGFITKSDTFVIVRPVRGLKQLPFDFSISPTLGVNSLTKPSQDQGATKAPGNPACARAESLPNATPGSPYKARIFTNWEKPTFKLEQNAPPAGLVFSEQGSVMGIPEKTAETSCFTVSVTRANPDTTVNKVFSIAVDQSAAGHGDSKGADAAAGQKDNSKAADAGKQSSSTSNAPVDCTAVSGSNPCTFTHTLHSYDHEWWDVSIAVAIPGVREPKYSTSNPAAAPSSTRHTDLYGMLDLYPAAGRATKDSGFPHVLVGLPVTGQPFYRPFFGLGENVTGWTGLQRHGFPLRMSVFFGIVDMHQEYAAKNPNTTAGQPPLVLKPERVWKFMFGIELPVSALISKIGGSKSASGGKAAGGS
jgi:hypothetical protein